MPGDRYALSREHMVDCQIATSGVLTPELIEALRSVPRELFVPEGLKGSAYIDEDLPLGNGRYLMEPMVFARLVEAAGIEPTDRVLDIGSGTGYSTAILSRIAKWVVGLEEEEALWQKAQLALSGLGIKNVELVGGNLTDGCNELAPFDVIILEGAADQVPEALLEQLSIGGRLVFVQREQGGLGHIWRYLKEENTVARTELFDASVPMLPGFEEKTGFEF